jgi:hypothetical protein
LRELPGSRGAGRARLTPGIIPRYRPLPRG